MPAKITLKRHVGLEVVRDPNTRQPLLDEETGQPLTVEVDHKQLLVIAGGKEVDGKLVGANQVAIYCGQIGEPGKYLSFISHYPEPFQKYVAEEVAKLVGGSVGKVGAPPPEEHDVPDDGS